MGKFVGTLVREAELLQKTPVNSAGGFYRIELLTRLSSAFKRMAGSAFRRSAPRPSSLGIEVVLATWQPKLGTKSFLAHTLYIDVLHKSRHKL